MGIAVTLNLTSDLTDFLVAEIAVVNSAGAIVHCNQKWETTARVGLLSPQASWNYIAECEAAIRRGCDDAIKILGGLRAVLRGEIPHFVDTYACPFNGLHHWFQLQISPFKFGNKLHALLMHVDVSSLQRDPLTGLPNRAMFDAQLDLALSLAHNVSRRTGMIIVDMNRLKLINDMYGHRVGDEALIALGGELKKSVDPDCVVARIGGDEFGVVLPVNNDTLSARRVRAHLRSGITFSVEGARNPISISASVGAAFYPDDGTTAKELLTSADKSMYAQKRSLSIA